MDLLLAKIKIATFIPTSLSSKNIFLFFVALPSLDFQICFSLVKIQTNNL
jgi:hypothetical protein